MEKEKPVKKVKITNEEHEKLLAKAEELERTKKELEDTKAKLEEVKDKLLRAAADFDNARKRLAKEKEEFVRFANERLIRGLLPILDNFERAIQHAGGSADQGGDSLKNGIVLIRKQLGDFLTNHGMVRLEVVGKKFDPHFHEAIGVIESKDHPDETVLEEVEAGYLLDKRLIRPAKVRISKSKVLELPAEPPAEDPSKEKNHETEPKEQ